MTQVSGVGNLGSSVDADGNFTKDTIKNGTIISKDNKKDRTGLYTYDDEGVPNNFITSDGQASFGNGQLHISNTEALFGKEQALRIGVDDTGNTVLEIKNVMTINTDKEGKVSYSFSDTFIEQIKQKIGGS